MFTGTTPPEVKPLLQDLMSNVSCKDVYIGCSGNFTTDRIMSQMGFTVHSNDVSLYSKLISDILLDCDTELNVVNPELKLVFDRWEESKYKKLVQIMFAIRVSGFHLRKNDYQEEMFDAFIEQSDIYYKNTIRKLEKDAFNFKIHDFYYGDFLDFLKSNSGKGIGIAFPPTYKGGYEKIFSFIEESFEYERASYNLFDPNNCSDSILDVLDKGENIIYLDKDWDVLKNYLVGKINLGHNKRDIFVYSSVDTGRHYYFEREKCEFKSKIEIIDLDHVFSGDTRIEIEQCKVSDVNYFKSFFMANKVDWSTGGDFGLVFKADGKAFGFASFSKQLSTLDTIFMQSDFVVTSKQEKLSKLLIMLVKSHEVRKILARKFGNWYTSVKTTVYTKSPVSMKYRSVFALVKRDDGKLIYQAEFSNETIKSIYNLWLKKYIIRKTLN